MAQTGSARAREASGGRHSAKRTGKACEWAEMMIYPICAIARAEASRKDVRREDADAGCGGSGAQARARSTPRGGVAARASAGGMVHGAGGAVNTCATLGLTEAGGGRLSMWNPMSLMDDRLGRRYGRLKRIDARRHHGRTDAVARACGCGCRSVAVPAPGQPGGTLWHVSVSGDGVHTGHGRSKERCRNLDHL